jgi:23S rRNA pseudouridine2604 synthase
MRLNKYISETGLCSRRQADALIAAGRVTINGQPIALGTQVGERDEVCVDGRPVRGRTRDAPHATRRVYIALNKPVGITCTTERHIAGNIIDFIGHPQRIFPIGRLDKDSEGLILLTSNGDIVNEILRAENEHEKEYQVTIDRPVTAPFLAGMAAGVWLPELAVRTRPCRLERTGANSFSMVLTQGLNRQIRRMCEQFGCEVRRLQRIRIINLQLGALRPGQWRDLSERELRGLLPQRRIW